MVNGQATYDCINRGSHNHTEGFSQLLMTWHHNNRLGNSELYDSNGTGW